MLVKEHLHEGKMLLACCDEKISGKEIVEGKKILNLNSSFYRGKKMSKNSFLELVKKAYIINAVGSECVNALVESGLIKGSDIMKISDTPYVQILQEH